MPWKQPTSTKIKWEGELCADIICGSFKGNISDFTNDSGFIILSSLSSTEPINYNSSTGNISLYNYFFDDFLLHFV